MNWKLLINYRKDIMLDRDYNRLSNMIASGRVKLVSSMLEKHHDIDVMHFDGRFLRLAIEGPNSYPEITALLLNYFKNIQLAKFQEGSDEYNNLKSRLKIGLEESIEDETLTEEMVAILSDYIQLRAEDTEYDLESNHDTNITKDFVEQYSDINSIRDKFGDVAHEVEGLMYGNLTKCNM